MITGSGRWAGVASRDGGRPRGRRATPVACRRGRLPGVRFAVRRTAAWWERGRRAEGGGGVLGGSGGGGGGGSRDGGRPGGRSGDACGMPSGPVACRSVR